MSHPLNDRLLAPAPLTASESKALVGTAQALRRAAQAGLPQLLLRGKHIALLCDLDNCEPAELFTTAATGLGARVSRVRPDAALLDDGAANVGAAATARMLGKLYDAVECDHMPADAARRLQREVGVPVFNGLGREDHPLADLLPALDGHGTPAEHAQDRIYLMQALLVNTIG